MTSAGCGAGRAARQAGRPRYPKHAGSPPVRLFVEDGMIHRPKRAEGRRGRGPTLADVRRTLRPPEGSGEGFDLAIGFAFHKSDPT